MKGKINNIKVVLVLSVLALIILTVAKGRMTIETPMWIAVCALVILDEKFTEEEHKINDLYRQLDVFIASIPVGILAGLIVADRMKLIHLETWMGILAILVAVLMLAFKKYAIRKLRTENN